MRTQAPDEWPSNLAEGRKIYQSDVLVSRESLVVRDRLTLPGHRELECQIRRPQSYRAKSASWVRDEYTQRPINLHEAEAAGPREWAAELVLRPINPSGTSALERQCQRRCATSLSPSLVRSLLGTARETTTTWLAR